MKTEVGAVTTRTEQGSHHCDHGLSDDDAAERPSATVEGPGTRALSFPQHLSHNGPNQSDLD